jgi:hypothetical protein
MPPTDVRRRGEPFILVQEGIMKKLLALTLLLCFVGTIVGCEASAKVDDDGAKVEVDKK